MLCNNDVNRLIMTVEFGVNAQQKNASSTNRRIINL